MNIAVLLSGGKGMRMNKPLPKQHIIMGDKEIIEYTLQAFSESECIDAIMIVSHSDYISHADQLRLHFPKLKWVIAGGTTRIQSAKHAVECLQSGICTATDKVIISDAVRPCISLREIADIINMLDTYEAVTTGVEIYETILKLENNTLTGIVPRDGVIRQTSPEGYKFSTLEKLYIQEKEDTISLYNNIGIDQLFKQGTPVGIVRSNPLNFKITTQEDLLLFETVLKQGFNTIINGS